MRARAGLRSVGPAALALCLAASAAAGQQAPGPDFDALARETGERLSEYL
ncbi:MAG TPA: hypothetical protein VFZ26_00035 [Gemmatimonadales bacterium]